MTNEAGLKCPKCNFGSGNDWNQCRGVCPMPMSPYYRPGWSPPTGVKELLAEYQVVNDALYRRWTNAVGASGYVKADWITVCNALSSRYRDAADALGYRGPLIQTLSEALPVVINQDMSPDVPGVAHEPFLSDARLAELLDGGYETQDEVHAMAMELSMQRKRNLPGGSQ